MNKGCFPHLSHRHGIFKKKKKDTFKSKWIKVNEVKKNHVALEETLGSPAGPVQEPSLGPGATAPAGHSVLSCLGNQLSQRAEVFHGQFPWRCRTALAGRGWEGGGGPGGDMKGP